MAGFLSLDELFEGRHFDREIIVLCVRWYLRFKLSFRDLVEMMAERGLSLAHDQHDRCAERRVGSVRHGPGSGIRVGPRPSCFFESAGPCATRHHAEIVVHAYAGTEPRQLLRLLCAIGRSDECLHDAPLGQADGGGFRSGPRLAPLMPDHPERLSRTEEMRRACMAARIEPDDPLGLLLM